MTDFRLKPDPSKVQQSQSGQIAAPVTDILRSPNGHRDRQALYGDALTILEDSGGWSYVQLSKDQYCGYVATTTIAPLTHATHFVSVPATHAYLEPDLKSPDQVSLSFNSKLTALGQHNGFTETALGFIPSQHLKPVGQFSSDLGEIAQLFLGTPYLWGGNSRWGIDCSGLVQAACLACDILCPGDSDQQMALLGDAVALKSDFRRNDLIFWKGHVAIVMESNLLIHANAQKMAVSFEPITDAIERIAKTDGPVLSHKRLPPSKAS
jgi:cell wall-associated NlpC family hydrolase